MKRQTPDESAIIDQMVDALKQIPPRDLPPEQLAAVLAGQEQFQQKQALDYLSRALPKLREAEQNVSKPTNVIQPIPPQAVPTYVTVGGKTYDLGLKLPFDAEVRKAARGLVAQLANEVDQKIPASHEPIPTIELGRAWLKANEQGWKPDTGRGYQKEVERFARHFEYLPTTPEPIEAYLKKGVKGKDYSSARRAYIYSVLKNLYEWVRDRKQPDLPDVIKAIRPQKVKHEKGLSYTLDELKRLFDVASDPRDIALLYLGIGQGFRPCEEMVRLNVSDVLEDRIYVRGKERKEWMSLDSEVRDALKPLLDGKGEDAPVFISQMKRRLSRDMAALRIKALYDKAGIRGTGRQKPYNLRHTFSTLMRDDGCDKASVDGLMRHVTEDVSAVYNHVSEERKLQLLRVKLEQHSPLRRLNGHQAPNSNKSDIPQNFLGSLKLG